MTIDELSTWLGLRDDARKACERAAGELRTVARQLATLDPQLAAFVTGKADELGTLAAQADNITELPSLTPLP